MGKLYIYIFTEYSDKHYINSKMIGMKKWVLGCLLLWVSLSQCVHDEFIKNTTVHYYNDLTERRMLQTSTTGPLRVFMDYTQVVAGGTLERNYIRRMMNITANYFYNLLTVQRLNQLVFPAGTNQQCNILRIPDIYVSQGTIGDVGVVVGSENTTANYMAKSTPCAFLASNKRPIWGVVIWNVNSFKYNNEGFQEMLFVGLHEMTHVLAFSALMYSTYPSGSVLGTTPAGDSYLKSPTLTPEVANYFGCPNTLGLDLEDQDGTLIASHWEKHHVGNEFMIASNKKHTYISRFTLALFNSTGWYPSVNFSLAEPMTWGKGRGCTFLNIDNCNWPEFCSGSAFGCDWDYTGIGRCQADPFTGTCFVEKYFNNTICIDEGFELNNLNAGLQAQERGGYTSRCHNSDFRLSGIAANSLNYRCYVTVCSVSGAYLYILVNGYTLVCRSPGQVIQAIPGFDGTLTCASDFTLYCNAKKTCAYNCNQNGACINGQCLCTGAIAFTSTCSATNPANDPATNTGGRLLFTKENKTVWKRDSSSLRREYPFGHKCEEGHIFDPITNKCETCVSILGCSKCNQKGCIE